MKQYSALLVLNCLLLTQPAWAETISAPSPSPAIHLRGVLLPQHQAKLTLAKPGTITYLTPAGTPVQQGATLIQLDDHEARLRLLQAEALLESARLTEEKAIHNRDKMNRLTGEHVVSAIAVKEAEFTVRDAHANLNKAQAEVELAHQTITNHRLTAPFNGVVTTLHAHLGEWNEPGKPLLEMADLTQLELGLDLPPTETEGLQPGIQTTLLLDGKTVATAELHTIMPFIDPASGLRRLVWRVTTPKESMLSGRYVTLTPWPQP